jgi:hypothetical protein
MEPLSIWIFTKDEELAVVLGDSPQGCPYYDAVLTEALNGVDKLEFSTSYFKNMIFQCKIGV